ncbi:MULTISPECIES: hypothetical protein [unclassified Mesorhizobium]|uniref:hypothetical protein n=1 Tax=unclassified Mesorhizobium TaxID=325217 RepID=UPI001093D58F|nr:MULTISPECIES: hypothetical protein [unclassified Mesorhizobium]TGS40704.1 hypothetical protein EN825_23670 [Mesorhizobium sp. M8A.F.Ca.ET.182.01.1.1]TGS78815.1 hypothetical protein EN824_21080 [Mesorhizobium sp. M8A.F.Ca.ET.181.01.1.1]
MDLSEAAHLAGDLVVRGEAEDLYVSQNAFRGWRRIAQLSTLGACYVDLDYRTRATHAGKPSEAVAEGILSALDEEGIPAPSYIMKTGRGLCAVWLTELLPRAALPRWQAVQVRLAAVLTRFGADKAALDAARVFRVAGSTNSRADPLDATVRMIWCQGATAAPYRHVFGDLADEVLPHTRAELRSLSVERAKRKAAGRIGAAGTPVHTLTTQTWAETLLTDLQRLRALRYPEGSIRSGERDKWLFCAAVAMSHLSPPAVLERELSALAMEAAGWTGAETKSRMSSALARARMAAAGTRLEHDGREVDPRYRMRSSTVIDWLEIHPGEMREAGLRMLVDQGRSRELATERQQASRRRKGAASRAEAQSARLALGRRALYLQARDGLSIRDLAAQFEVSMGQLSKAISEAVKNS